IGETGHPENILMGHLDPSAPWDHVGALDPERAEANSKGWMLPSSHLMIGESPQAAAERILKEQLGLPASPLKGPFVFSEVNWLNPSRPGSRRPGLPSEWKFRFSDVVRTFSVCVREA